MWLWTITDPITKRRRQTRHRMTEKDALGRHGADAVKVQGSLEIRRYIVGRTRTGDFLRRKN
jgi:hypothetical protein